MDFDVLAHNLPANTSGVDADTNPKRIRSFMEAQKKDMGVTYTPNSTSPLEKKLIAQPHLICFRVQLFGGVVEVIAENFEIVDAN